MEDCNTKALKVVLLGNSGAGKSSIAKRFVFNKFEHYPDSTIGASFFSKHMILDNNIGVGLQKLEEQVEPICSEPGQHQKSVKFHVWDTAGQEKYHSLAAMYYRGARAAVLVYDICNGPSFEALKSWLQRLKEFGPKDLITLVVGNKCDLHDRRQVDKERAEKFANSEKCLYLETSARDGVNVEMIFQEIARLLKIDEINCDSNSSGTKNNLLLLTPKSSIREYACGC